MQNGLSQNQELKEMQDHVRRVVNSLELCWHCERICECERWAVNQAIAVWLCAECLSETLQGLAQPSEFRVSVRTALPKLLSDLNNSGRLPVEVERKQVWTKVCPRCKAVMEKKRSEDSWSCARCGWQ